LGSNTGILACVFSPVWCPWGAGGTTAGARL
jgi:hypothetical protein